MMTTERRRNQYLGTCCVCGATVEPGQGWLYLDQKHRRRGFWPKKVKCDRCHQAGAVHVSDLQPKETIKRWSVRDVRGWTIESSVNVVSQAGRWLGDGVGYENVDAKVADVFVCRAGERFQVAGVSFLGRQDGVHYDDEWKGIFGRPFTPAAFAELHRRVEEEIARVCGTEGGGK